jgi:hypothetical protein
MITNNTMIINSDCENCIHKAICNKRSIYEKHVDAVKNISVSNTNSIEDNFIHINISCRYYSTQERIKKDPKDIKLSNTNATYDYQSGIWTETYHKKDYIEDIASKVPKKKQHDIFFTSIEDNSVYDEGGLDD